MTKAVVALENNGLFNAGHGAVFTLDGRNELDASIMNGATLEAGAVCGLTRVRNPIELARAVMEHSEYVFLSGAGAEEFAASRGFEFVGGDYFYTDARWRQLERIRGGDGGLSPLTISHVGTVGAVALDSAGRLAAATSTGGMTGKRFGRIGDSPVIGAGTYADDRSCAVSATGHGEMFIRAAVAHDICARVRFGGRTLGEAVHQVVMQELPALGGEGGVIAIDREGRIADGIQLRGHVPRQPDLGRERGDRHLSDGSALGRIIHEGGRFYTPSPGQADRCPPRRSKRPVRSVWYSASSTTTRLRPCSLAPYNASSAS